MESDPSCHSLQASTVSTPLFTAELHSALNIVDDKYLLNNLHSTMANKFHHRYVVSSENGSYYVAKQTWYFELLIIFINSNSHAI